MKKSTIVIWHIIYAVFCLVAPLFFSDSPGETNMALVVVMYAFFILILGLIYWLLGTMNFPNFPKGIKKFDSIAGPILILLGLVFIIGNFIKVSEIQTRYDDGFLLTSIDMILTDLPYG